MEPSFSFQEMFPTGPDTTAYRLLTADHVSAAAFEKTPVIKVDRAGLVLLAETAFREVSHLLRPSHLKQTAAILNDPESSANDRYVALEMIKNAVVASGYVFPICQDTGTATVMGKKGQRVWTGFSDEAALSEGIFNAYRELNLRYSQVAPLTLYEEANTKTNLPAQIDLYAVEGDAYRFLFIAKGGGSANKTFLFQKTKAVLNPDALLAFLKTEIAHLGTAACPPYHLAVVIGGTSAEAVLKTVKLASAGYLDSLPDKGGPSGHAFRDRGLEAELFKISCSLNLGAQFGGKYLCHDVKVIRMPRHGASCPIGMGLSCSADRNLKAKITKEGIFVEQLETDPAQYLPAPSAEAADAARIDLARPLAEVREDLSRLAVGTRLLLNGPVIVARDIAHARVKEMLDAGKPLPSYMTDYMILYAGPAKTPEGYPSGSLGPTTSARMDPYVTAFQPHGGALVTLGKGNRSQAVIDACKTNGGFYLGTIGGVAAILGKECITGIEVIDFPELGMEAVQRVTVKDFPAFLITDDKGNDFFKNLAVG
ncbi:MAG: FumA C-terminus/TtdB family hydratase beta subunit [Thermodesulfobacteriota bacterium]|nr:FumA C-terminus/TtdB family hydratase beta subunit [Thermodesulfobacteriota bacterium]